MRSRPNALNRVRHPAAVLSKLTLAGTFLTACAVPPYVAPANAPIAHVDLVSKLGVVFDTLDPRTCPSLHRTVLADFTDAATMKASRPVADAIGHRVGSLALGRDIEAGRPIILGAGFGHGCGVAYRFVPEAGARYEAEADIVGANCRFRIYRVAPQSSDGGTVRALDPSVERFDACSAS